MSTIKADTIVASDGTSPVTLTKQNGTKVFGSYNMTGDEWAEVNSGSAGSESLNVSSFSDVATGELQWNMTNAMSAVQYVIVTCVISNANVGQVSHDHTRTTTVYETKSHDTGSENIVDSLHFANVNGDLA